MQERKARKREQLVGSPGSGNQLQITSFQRDLCFSLAEGQSTKSNVQNVEDYVQFSVKNHVCFRLIKYLVTCVYVYISII